LALTPAELQGQDLRFWHAVTGAAAQILVDQAEEFNRTNQWGLQVALRAFGSEFELEEALRQVDPEEAPQVVLAPSELLASWQAQDELADLSLYMPAPVWGFGAETSALYDERYLGQERDGEVQFGLPALRTALGLIYNRSFAADLGFTASPDTPDELMAQACAAAKDNNRYYLRYGTGGWMFDTHPLVALSWLRSFGASVEPKAGAITWLFDSPAARETLTFLNELQAKGCVWIPKFPTPQTYFSGRQAFLYNATLQDLLPQQGAMESVANEDEWSFIAYPSQDGRGVVYAYGYSYAVLRGNPKQQMAGWLFVRWMSEVLRLTRLAEVYPSLPVRADVRINLESKAGEFPWTVILPLADKAQPAPSQDGWRVVRRPLQDAFWQVFNLSTPDQLDQVLPMLDALIAKELSR
jgi:ABC-type glycerol-3-phosphate transport system substrate-binding protein